MVYLISAALLFAASGIFAFWYSGFSFKGLPVLMYHRVSDSGLPDDLTITSQQLARQFRYLIKKKYNTILLSDLINFIDGKKALPPNPVLLTFDDGYKDNFTCLYPLLEQYGMKANIFLIAGFVRSAANDEPRQPGFLHVDDIMKMNSDLVQFGLHSYDHKSYNDLTISQVEEDIQNCRLRLNQLGISYQPCLAYTFGAYPRKDLEKRNQLFSALQANGIRLAFRIGNRLNKFPLNDKYLLQRIDIRGDESFGRFKLILVAGKKILFK